MTDASCWHFSFRCISLSCWAYFSDVMVSLGFRKLECIRPAADHQAVTMTFFGCKFGFGKCFGASSLSSHWASHHQLYKIQFSSHVRHNPIEKWFIVVYRIRGHYTSKWQFFKFSVRSRGTDISSFLTFPVCFKCQTTIERSTLSSLTKTGAGKGEGKRRRGIQRMR